MVRWRFGLSKRDIFGIKGMYFNAYEGVTDFLTKCCMLPLIIFLIYNIKTDAANRFFTIVLLFIARSKYNRVSPIIFRQRFIFLQVYHGNRCLTIQWSIISDSQRSSILNSCVNTNYFRSGCQGNRRVISTGKCHDFRTIIFNERA